MLTVHHLENSRSQRILWLLEELDVPYDIKHYKRDEKTNLAPTSLMKVHPLGKSPVIEDNGIVLAETGAIIEYIVDTYGDGRLRPKAGTPATHAYRYWLHAAEGTFMPSLVFTLFLNRMETAPMPFFMRPLAKKLTGGARDGYLTHTMKAQYDFLEESLEDSAWLAGPDITAADIIMSFPVEAFAARGNITAYPHIAAYKTRLQERRAYKKALERGGPYAF